MNDVRQLVVREGRAVERKPHKTVPQEHYLSYLGAHGPTSLENLAYKLNVSDSTATRKLRGLLEQGKVVVERRRIRATDIYKLPEDES